MQGPLSVLMFAPLGVSIWDLVLICSYTFGFGLSFIRNNINLYNRWNTDYLGLTDTITDYTDTDISFTDTN